MQHNETHSNTVHKTGFLLSFNSKKLNTTGTYRFECVLQCVAASCSALQCVTVCCSVLQCAAVCCSVLRVLQGVAVCYSVLRVLQCVAVGHVSGRMCDMTPSCKQHDVFTRVT